jgi:hypothetical protein
MRKLLYSIGAVLFLFISSCTTDVDLNAPYKSTTVVFGLLDPDSSMQWIKINKTFLGDGNNLNYAQIRDSSEYRWEEFKSLVILELENNVVIKTHPLNDTVVSKDPYGLFYAPLQTVYYVNTPNGLNPQRTYKLVADFYDREDIEATTNLVGTDAIGFQTPQPGTFISLAQYNSTNFDINYNDNVNVKWTPVANVEKYDLTLRFKFTEEKYQEQDHINLISSTPITIDYYIGAFNADALESQGGYVTASFAGESFFSYLKNTLTADPKIRRVIGQFDGTKTRCFEVVMAMANDELKTYLDVNAPVTGVIQERPIYTNVTNGLGLFGSRSAVSIPNLALYGSAMQMGNLYAFGMGSYCDGLNFCDPDPTSDFSCQ